MTSALQLQDTLFTPRSEPTDLDTTDLHDLSTGFHSMDLSADRRLV